MSDTSIYHKLQCFEFFKNLSEVELKSIATQAKITHLSHNRSLFKEGGKIESVYLVLYGSFKIQQTPSEQEPVIFSFLSRGDFLGIAMASLKNAIYPASAIANEESAVIEWPLRFFNEKFMFNTQLRQIVHQQISSRFFEFQNDRCMVKSLAPQKLADFILRTLDRQPKENGMRLMIPTTRYDIARKIGSQAETVIRLISAWTKKGYIRTEDKHIEVLDRAKLEEIRIEKSSRKTSRAITGAAV
ncbi:Crp/Fnr family transcriptional regulator [Bdellovibrio reynosensis]|uniref:Crp/Fnr family transcriptional regulator n=1 Tax=Bdellovibrio reynosensis TaxID=2835041 RepID=A0ABY4CAN5_9BACT|nr:Crp/Fnr family transcriptional regulator [Bdellovibrio reynosensis]UOF01529.1 Crp/Fnr family transcriptional regulator [Bdellovibrio reynosensis]